MTRKENPSGPQQPEQKPAGKSSQVSHDAPTEFDLKALREMTDLPRATYGYFLFNSHTERILEREQIPANIQSPEERFLRFDYEIERVPMLTVLGIGKIDGSVEYYRVVSREHAELELKMDNKTLPEHGYIYVIPISEQDYLAIMNQFEPSERGVRAPIRMPDPEIPPQQ